MVAGDIFHLVNGGEALGRERRCSICANAVVLGGSQILTHRGWSGRGSVSGRFDIANVEKPSCKWSDNLYLYFPFFLI